jgi:hypothetical protein
MTYTEMMAMPDPVFDNSEDNSEPSNPSTSPPPSPPPPPVPIPTNQSTPSRATHTINVNYHHSHSIHRKDGEDLNIPGLLQTLSDISRIQTPSHERLIPQASSILPASTAPSQVKPKTKTLIIGTRSITFTALDLPDLPHISFATDMHALLRCWDNASYKYNQYLKIKDTPVPIKY